MTSRRHLQPAALAALAVPAVGLAAAAGWANLHSDDTGILAGFVLLSAAVYGFVLGPRWAWLAGAFFASTVPLSALASVAFAIRAPFTGPPSLPAVVLPLLFGVVGAYLGAGIRSLSRS